MNLVPIDCCSELIPYTDEEFMRAADTLKKHVRNKGNYRANQYILSKGVTINHDLSGQNLRRSYYVSCKFLGANLNESGFSGSIFASTDFQNCQLNFTNLQSCEFNHCTFTSSHDTLLESTKFDKSIFVDGALHSCTFHAASFLDAYVYGTNISNCWFRSTNFENTHFENCVFDHARFKDMNLEFMHINNVRFNMTTLPFPSIPYIFGGIEYILSTTDSVRITSKCSKANKISKEEYIDLLGDLVVFFTNTHNFFPLVNILLALKKYSEAKIALMNGIDTAIALRNYRYVLYYSYLIADSTVISLHERLCLFKYICETGGINSNNTSDLHGFSYYLPQIKKSLLEGGGHVELSMVISTDIEPTEYSKVASFLEIIDLMVDIFDVKANRRVELQHGSPYEIFVYIVTSTAPAIGIIGTVYAVFLGIDKIYNRLLSDITLFQQAIKNSKEIALQKLQIENVELDNAIKKNQLNEMERNKLALIEKTKAASIIVSSVSHSALNINTDDKDIRNGYARREKVTI